MKNRFSKEPSMFNATAENFLSTKGLKNFWVLVVDVWKNGVFGVNIGHLVVAIGILILFLILRRLLTKFIMSRLERLVDSSSAKTDNSILKALKEPVRFIPVVLGIFFALQYLDFQEPFETFADNCTKSLILLDIFWAFFNLVTPLSLAFEKLERVLTSSLVNWLVKLIKFLVLLVGVSSILELWGIDIGPILAGLGLFSVAVALGAKDLFQNLIAGISILAERRFKLGDWILVDGKVEGTVESIGFRSTLIRRFDKAPVYVPNATLSDNCVTNFSMMTHRRVRWVIGVEYRTTVDQLRMIRDRVIEYIMDSKEFAHPPEVTTFMRVESFNDSSIDFLLYCFTKTTVWTEWLRIREELAFRIKQIVEDEAGAAFAFPSQSVYVETLPGESPDIFIPPTKE
jgi:MscS family membrane protein